MSATGLRVPSSYSRIIARELQLQERDLDRLLEGTGLSSAMLQPEDDSAISAEQQLRILDNVVALVGAENAGLRVGAALEPAAHGPLGFLALSSATPLRAIESLRDFLPTRIPFTAIILREESPYLVCEQDILVSVTAAQRRLIQEAFAVIVQQLVEAVLGRELDGSQFSFSHERPAYYRRYRRFLHGRLYFGAARTAVRIPQRLLAEGNTSGDPATYRHARSLCEQLLAQTPGESLSTRGRVRRLLLQKPPGSLGEEQIARSLFISRRTLARRLADEGCSYRQLREEIWAELASKQLLQSSMSVESIAAMLGYSDSAAFRKAFRRWYGEAPSAFRTRLSRTHEQ